MRPSHGKSIKTEINGLGLDGKIAPQGLLVLGQTVKHCLVRRFVWEKGYLVILRRLNEVVKIKLTTSLNPI